jgi:hypothetical protein
MTRAALPPLLLALLALPPAPLHAAGPWSVRKGPRGIRAIADGRAETPAGSVPALLRVQCARAELCVSLKVEEASRIQEFDFARFASPNGAERPPLHVRAGDELTLDAPVEGEWSRDPEGAFAFAFCGPAHAASDAAQVAQAIARGVGEIEMRDASPGGEGREIRARFPADAQDRAVVEVLKRCPAH